MKLKLVIGSVRQDVADHCAELLADLNGIEYRVGSPVEAALGCDVALMNFQFAMDRYGGRPEFGKSNIVKNTRNDGFPSTIVTTPPFEPGPPVADEDELQDRLYIMFSKPVEAILTSPFLRDRTVILMLIHVEGLGLDRIGLDRALSALRRVLLADW